MPTTLAAPRVRCRAAVVTGLGAAGWRAEKTRQRPVHQPAAERRSGGGAGADRVRRPPVARRRAVAERCASGWGDAGAGEGSRQNPMQQPATGPRPGGGDGARRAAPRPAGWWRAAAAECQPAGRGPAAVGKKSRNDPMQQCSTGRRGGAGDSARRARARLTGRWRAAAAGRPRAGRCAGGVNEEPCINPMHRENGGIM